MPTGPLEFGYFNRDLKIQGEYQMFIAYLEKGKVMQWLVQVDIICIW